MPVVSRMTLDEKEEPESRRLVLQRALQNVNQLTFAPTTRNLSWTLGESLGAYIVVVVFFNILVPDERAVRDYSQAQTGMYNMGETLQKKDLKLIRVEDQPDLQPSYQKTKTLKHVPMFM